MEEKKVLISLNFTDYFPGLWVSYPCLRALVRC